MMLEKNELEKVVSFIRREIENSELSKKISEMDSKLVELRKSVEGIVIELTYIKAELKELREREDKKRVTTMVKKEKEQEKLEISESKKPIIKEERIEEGLNRKVEMSDDKDLIICD